MRYAVLVLATTLFPCFAIAAEVGQFINPATGDSVTVRLTPSGNNYNARIDTRKGNAKCLFDHVMNEVNEGDLRYNAPHCALRVLERDASNLSVTVITGCRSFCSGTATLRISHAVKQ